MAWGPLLDTCPGWDSSTQPLLQRVQGSVATTLSSCFPGEGSSGPCGNQNTRGHDPHTGGNAYAKLLSYPLFLYILNERHIQVTET